MKTKQKATEAATDRLARAIANRIIRLQSGIAGALNKLANRYPTRRQKLLLLLFSALTAAAITAQLWIGTYRDTWPKDTGRYPATHIGKPSDLPQPAITTKSLTLKNRLLWKTIGQPAKARRELKHF